MTFDGNIYTWHGTIDIVFIYYVQSITSSNVFHDFYNQSH